MGIKGTKVYFKADHGHVLSGEVVGFRKSRTGKTVVLINRGTMFDMKNKIIPYIHETNTAAIIPDALEAEKIAKRRARSCNCDRCRRVRGEI